tara:strand:+ start:1011 stop:1907 length:897 start_codon:yes stop_codon:yes gene_type:complete
MIVVGAGMAGLLAAAMLRSECTCVAEKQDKIPNNHSAVLRFRSKIVADVLNIPFKEVDVLKAVQPWRNPVADALSYSFKTNGTSTLRSSTTANGEMVRRYIAPPDLIQRMVNCVQAKISPNMDVDPKSLSRPCISTMPMPTLMELLGWRDRVEFHHIKGTNIHMHIDDMDAYCSLYVPDPVYPFSRISITGSEAVVETHGPIQEQPRACVNMVAKLLGVNSKRIGDPVFHSQPYSKILPIDDHVRKRFMLWATEKHNVYSLGRFATWRPGLLLDDVVNDVRVIHRMIHGGTTYEGRKS